MSAKKMAAILKLLTILLLLAANFCQGENNNNFGRAKAKISQDEMLKLHRKRREENDKFTINRPRKNEEENQVRQQFYVKWRMVISVAA